LLARKSERRPIHGWLIVNKTAGHTSSAVVQKLKWVLNAQKAGHAGTLDPDASGILAIALGEATKTIPYLTNDLKGYIFTVSLGTSTNTDDATGDIIDKSSIRPTNHEIQEACKTFLGNIKQVPPIFSAVKVNGQRAYKMARMGAKNLNLVARDLWVEELKILERTDKNNVIMKLVCGKGGYVRSLARDLGRNLGCFAHIATLKRVSSGPFSLSKSLSDKFIFSENVAKIKDSILPVDSALKNLHRFECTIEEANDINNGKAIDINFSLVRGADIFVSYKTTPIAIGQIVQHKFYPKKVFRLLLE